MKLFAMIFGAVLLAGAASADQRVTACEKAPIPGTNATACISSTITGTFWIPNENGSDPKN